MSKVTTNESLKDTLASHSLQQQRLIGACFIKNVLDLSDVTPCPYTPFDHLQACLPLPYTKVESSFRYLNEAFSDNKLVAHCGLAFLRDSSFVMIKR